MKRKKNYVMGKLNTPKGVTLPDGRSFLACYERVPRSELPPNVIMKRSHKTKVEEEAFLEKDKVLLVF